jgi:hypothetical protein
MNEIFALSSMDCMINKISIGLNMDCLNENFEEISVCRELKNCVILMI